MWWVRELLYIERRYLTLCSWHSRIWQFPNSSQTAKQQWRPWVCTIY